MPSLIKKVNLTEIHVNRLIFDLGSNIMLLINPKYLDEKL